MEFYFYNFQDFEGPYDLEPILAEYYANYQNETLVLQAKTLIENIYLGREYLLLAIDNTKIVGLMIYSNKNLFQHGVIYDVYFIKGYESRDFVYRMLNAYTKEKSIDKFCVISTYEPNPIWERCGFERTTAIANKENVYLLFYTEKMKEICDLNLLYRRQPFLENETIGDYYFKIHKANRNEYSRIFFTSMILFAAPSIPFIGALIALFSDRTPFLIIVFLFLFLLEVMGIVFYLMLKTHKKRSEYVFGFHYIRLVMGYEWEGIK